MHTKQRVQYEYECILNNVCGINASKTGKGGCTFQRQLLLEYYLYIPDRSRWQAFSIS